METEKHIRRHMHALRTMLAKAHDASIATTVEDYQRIAGELLVIATATGETRSELFRRLGAARIGHQQLLTSYDRDRIKRTPGRAPSLLAAVNVSAEPGRKYCCVYGGKPSGGIPTPPCECRRESTFKYRFDRGCWRLTDPSNHDMTGNGDIFNPEDMA